MRRIGTRWRVFAWLAFSLCAANPILAQSPRYAKTDASASQADNQSLKQLSLEQLGQIEVTTASKQPVAIWQTAAAIYVITQDDIRRSGATSIPEALRLAPGV